MLLIEAGIEGDLELRSDGPKEPFDFSTALRYAGAGMDKRDAERVQDAVRLVGDKSGSVVGVEATRPAVRPEDVEDAALELEGILAETEMGVENTAGGVVEEGYEDGLAQLPRVVGDIEGVHVVDLDALEGILVAETLDLALRRDMEAGGPVKAARTDEAGEG